MSNISLLPRSENHYLADADKILPVPAPLQATITMHPFPYFWNFFDMNLSKTSFRLKTLAHSVKPLAGLNTTIWSPSAFPLELNSG